MSDISTLTEQQATAFRLHRHGLTGDRSALKPGRLASVICGAQAQVLSAAQLSIAIRSHSITPDIVARELWRQRTLVKVWSMRSTLHLHAAADLPLYLGGLAIWGRSIEKWLRKQGIEGRQLERITLAIMDLMEDKPMTRGELADCVAAEHGEEFHGLIAHGWGGLLKHLVYSGFLVFGPSRGGDTTFVRADRWLEPIIPANEEESLMEIARRYLRVFGPATPQDFSYWSGLPVAHARSTFARLRDETVDLRVGDRPHTLLRRDLSHARNATLDAGAVVVLPYFDTYMLGHRTKDHLLEPGRYKSVYRSAGWIASVVLVDGRVAGTWTSEARGGELVMRLVPHLRMNRAMKGRITEAMERVGGYGEMGRGVKVVINDK